MITIVNIGALIAGQKLLEALRTGDCSSLAMGLNKSLKNSQQLVCVDEHSNPKYVGRRTCRHGGSACEVVGYRDGALHA